MEQMWQRSLKIACAVMLIVLVFQLLFIEANKVDWLAIPFSGLLYLAIIYLVSQFKKSETHISSDLD